jgi:hypothetical protein
MTTALFGLDANILPPPFSAILSLAMLAGVDGLGVVFLRALPSFAGKATPPWLRYQAPVVGAALLAAVIFPLALAGVFFRPLALGLAVALATAGASQGARLLQHLLTPKQITERLRDGSPIGFALAALALGYGLLALGPVTEADSLDYHIGVALEILNTGGLPIRPEWFHSRLAGSGEVLIALGLAAGAEQFGALLQALGVLSIASLFVSLPNREGTGERWIALALLSCPVFVAWVASPKPMLLPGAMTTTALLLTFFRLRSHVMEPSPTGIRTTFLLVCLLTMVAATMKLNFLLSGGVVGGWAMLLLLRSRFRWHGALIAALMFCLTLLPFALWKSHYFGGTVLGALLTPLPGNWPGTAEFEALLRAYRDTNIVFPTSLIVPAGIGTVTTVLGAGLLVILSCGGLLRIPLNREIAILALIVSAGGMVLGQHNARFFLEPFYWLLIACHLGGGLARGRAERAVKVVLSVQAVAVAAMLAVGIAGTLPGALLPHWRDKIMDRMANGYTAMKWAGEVLPPEVAVISTLRSVALLPRFAIANDWRAFVDQGSIDERVYIAAIVAKQPEFILVTAEKDGLPPQMPCSLSAYAGPHPARVATRNPFNAGSTYDSWILRIDPSCLGR